MKISLNHQYLVGGEVILVRKTLIQGIISIAAVVVAVEGQMQANATFCIESTNLTLTGWWQLSERQQKIANAFFQFPTLFKICRVRQIRVWLALTKKYH